MGKILFISMAIMLMSCNKDGNGEQKDCSGAICTEIFMMANMYITDSSNRTLKLDSYYSVNNDTKDTFRTQQEPFIDGSYVILDDNYTGKMHNKTYSFNFIAIKTGKVVVNEPFTASADCCHISKVSGKDTVVVK